MSPSTSVSRIEDSKVKATFGGKCIDLLSAALGGTVLGCSDEWFASAENLITPSDPIRKFGVFTFAGAWYDGWETRRHNPEEADWVIIKLGVASGRIHGVEIDTAFFNGNHAPEVSVEGTFLGGGYPDENTQWKEIMPRQECGPSQRHIWVLDKPTERAYSHVRLKMYPDGGIARFRLFGTAVPVFPSDPDAIIDLAHVSCGGLVTSYSDEHFGVASNLLLPGRGKDMGDGWETKRSREKGHTDWVIVQLGAPGIVEEIVVDTAHFRGNYPKEVKIEGTNSRDRVPGADAQWKTLIPATACRPDHEHAFPSTALQNAGGNTVYTHIKMTIIPDGGVKRLRVFGKRAI